MRFTFTLRWILAVSTVALLACSSTPLSRGALDGGGSGVAGAGGVTAGGGGGGSGDGGGGGSGGSGEDDASGAAGQAADAAAGTGGGPSTVSPFSSAGCNKQPAQALGQFVKRSVHVTGATRDPNVNVAPHDRDFVVRLPPTYVPSAPHRIVFVAPACGATGTEAGRLMPADPKAIFVGLAAPPTSVVASGCPDVAAGAGSIEWEYFALVAADVERSFCIDRSDEVVAGVRSGATLANMLGCYFSGLDPSRAFGPDLALRAQFSIASSRPEPPSVCGGPIAGFWMHDKNEVNPVSDSTTSLERVLKLDGCAGGPTEAWGMNELAVIGCRKFSACPSRYPVIFCETTNLGRQSNYFGVTVPALRQFLAQ